MNRHLNGDRTALMHASANGQSDIVKLLLDENVDTLTRDDNGKTAAEIASTNGHTHIADQIIKHRLGVTADAG